MWRLGIESSCDETGVALVRVDAALALPVLAAQALHTQAAMHEAYGGVVPELASRDHIRRVLPLIQQVMHEAGVGLDKLDVIAYTRGPGLAGALLVGAGTACALAASKVVAEAKTVCIMKTRRVLDRFELMVFPPVKN
jgi:N6-L-threonylcarbamoyladenine synthase